MLSVESFGVRIGEQIIVEDVSLDLPSGEIQVLMGANGSGKSTLAMGLLGYPGYQVQGRVMLDNVDLTAATPDTKTRAGLFLSLQSPPALDGISVMTLLKHSYQAIRGEVSLMEFRTLLYAEADRLGIDRSFLTRSVHQGFSGGEKKRLELLQLSVLKPRYAILDEPDSGLDVDGVGLLATELQRLVKDGMGCLLITHYPGLIEQMNPQKVLVMKQGRIHKTGDISLAIDIIHKGFHHDHQTGSH